MTNEFCVKLPSGKEFGFTGRDAAEKFHARYGGHLYRIDRQGTLIVIA